MYQNKNETITIKSTADLSAGQYKVVDIDGTYAAAASLGAGVLQVPSSTKQTSGDWLTVAYSGVVKTYAGGTITIGQRLAQANSGWVTAATSAQIAAGDTIGKCLVAASSGDVFAAIVNFAT